MLRKTLLLALTIGVATSFQRRFGLPATFSFRTVHNPSQNVPTPAPNTFFFRPSQVTLPPSMFQPAPTATDQSQGVHVPVMVPVPQDFKGDSVVVTPEQLSAMKISTAVVDSATINKAVSEQTIPETEIFAEPAAEVVPEQLTQQIEPVMPISAGDDAFVLTPAEPVETAPVAKVEPEVLPQPIQPVFETIPEAQVPVQQSELEPASPFSTSTFSAHQEFLNTWLRLASVNLNRPELLNLVKPTGQRTAPQPVQNSPSMFEGSISHAPIVQETRQVAEIVADPQPIAQEVPFLEETPLVLATVPEEASPTAEDKTSKDIFSNSIIENELVHQTNSNIEIQDSLLDTFVDITTVMPEIEIATSPIEPVEIPGFEEQISGLIQEEVVAPIETPVESLVESPIETPVVQEAPQNIVETSSIVEPSPINEINTNSVAQPQQAETQSPFLLNAIPRITSRGRVSGFRYSFSHIPQRGTYFFNSIAS